MIRLLSVGFRKIQTNIHFTRISSWISSVAASSDSKSIVPRSYDNAIKVWDLQEGKEILIPPHLTIEGIMIETKPMCPLSWTSPMGLVFYSTNLEGAL